MRWIFLCVVLLLVPLPALASHDKTDVVTVKDGTRYLGEIMNVQTATVTLKTNAAGTLSIGWRYVTGIESKYQYRVELSGGLLLYGSLAPAEEPSTLRVVATDGPVDVRLVDVAQILPIETTLGGRLDGSVSFGLTYTNANAALQYNASVDASYRGPKNIATFSGKSIFNTQSGGSTTSQQYVDLTVSQVIGAGWGAFELGQLQSNPDQGYDTRLVLGGGGTHLFKESARVMINANLGVVYNREDVTGSGEVDKTGELLVGAAYRQFKHSSYAPRISVQFNTFSDFSGSGRFRFSLASEISWKIIGNLTLDVQLNDSYDSSPPGEDPLKNNFTFVTSLGFTF